MYIDFYFILFVLFLLFPTPIRFCFLSSWIKENAPQIGNEHKREHDTHFGHK